LGSDMLKAAWQVIRRSMLFLAFGTLLWTVASLFRAEASAADSAHGEPALVWLECKYKETAHFKDAYHNQKLALSPKEDTSVIAINIKDQQIAEWNPTLGRLNDWEKVSLTDTTLEWKEQLLALRVESRTVTIDRASLRYVRRFMSEPELNSRDDVVIIEWVGHCQKRQQPRGADKRQF
jgi:hypothetical protein